MEYDEMIDWRERYIEDAGVLPPDDLRCLSCGEYMGEVRNCACAELAERG